ncbi:regulatory protein RecX [Trifolium repens]|nr:regulatory protein RecX [Trifolium repens]
MASFAGNIGFKISSQLQLRVFSIPRNIWKFQIGCLKSRDFSSCCVTVNFTDGNVIKINDGKIGHATIAHYETSQNPDEVHNELLFDDSEEGSEQMEEVGELIGDSREQDFIQVDKFTNDAEQSAVKLLASRALTAVELRKKLLSKGFSPNAVEAVINKLQRQGFINDKLYAESFSQSRWSSSTWGPRRIKQALFMKGVSQADAEKAVEVVFKDNNDCAGDEKSIVGLSKQSMDHLYVQASKQWSRGQNVPLETRKSRIIRWLQYRGFDWNVISIILKKLDKHEQNPP